MQRRLQRLANNQVRNTRRQMILPGWWSLGQLVLAVALVGYLLVTGVNAVSNPQPQTAAATPASTPSAEPTSAGPATQSPAPGTGQVSDPSGTKPLTDDGLTSPVPRYDGTGQVELPRNLVKTARLAFAAAYSAKQSETIPLTEGSSSVFVQEDPRARPGLVLLVSQDGQRYTFSCTVLISHGTAVLQRAVVAADDGYRVTTAGN